jgi:LPXTG-motif cell wall-anchored protein
LRTTTRILRSLALLFGALSLLAASAGTVGASQPERDGTIHQALPISGDSFKSEDDCGPITEGTAWHFLLNNTTVPTEGSTLTAVFRDAKTKTVGVHKIDGGATHYFVGTGTGDVLLDAWVSTGDGQLQLSHVCAAGKPTTEPELVECPEGFEGPDGATMVEDLEQCVPVQTEPELVECPEGFEGPDGETMVEDVAECVQVEDDDVEKPGNGAELIWICHALGNGDFIFISVSKEGILNGHAGDQHQDGRDIIPAFDDFPGQNTTATELTEDDCVIDDDDDNGNGNGNGDNGVGNGDDGNGEDGNGSVPVIETPVEEIPETIVEGDVVTPTPQAPAPQAPVTIPEAVPSFAAPVAVPSAAVERPAVLGDTVTRTVSGELPRTGSDASSALVPFGLLLLLAGAALHRTGRRVGTTA